MKPTFIGLGAQKCASSWLYRIFSDHPEAHVSTPKELDFFSCHFHRGYHWYEHHFSAPADRVAVGEISPSYLPDWEAPSRAWTYDPSIRLLVALRDPVERAYSQHLHNLRLGYFAGDDISFEAGIAQNPSYVEQSLYAKHLGRWLQFFPPQQLLVVVQEEIVADPQGQAKRVYEFLGIRSDHESAFSDQRANESYLPRSHARERFMRHAGAATRMLGLSWVNRALHASGLVEVLRRRNRMNIREIVPPISEPIRTRLFDLFANDTLTLGRLLGRHSLPWATWRYAAAQASERSTVITTPRGTP